MATATLDEHEQLALARLADLRAELAFATDLFVERDEEGRIFVRAAGDVALRERIWDHQSPEQVAASYRARQLAVAPTADELAEHDRLERQRVRQRAIEQLRRLEEAQQRAIDLDAILVERARASRPRGPSRERRPTPRCRTARARASRDGPDESEPPLGRLPVTPSRACCVCGDPLDGHYSNAVTCTRACRQNLYRERKKARELPQPDPDLLARYDRAVDALANFQHPGKLDPDWLLGLLADVLDPSRVESRLREAA